MCRKRCTRRGCGQLERNWFREVACSIISRFSDLGSRAARGGLDIPNSRVVRGDVVATKSARRITFGRINVTMNESNAFWSKEATFLPIADQIRFLKSQILFPSAKTRLRFVRRRVDSIKVFSSARKNNRNTRLRRFSVV